MVPDWDEIKNLKISKDGVLSGSYMGKKFSLDLDRRLGNKNGKFDLEGKNFSESSSMLRIKYPGILSGNLKKGDGFFTNFDEISLHKIVEIRRDNMVFIRRSFPRGRNSPMRKTSTRRISPKRKEIVVNELQCTIL